MPICKLAYTFVVANNVLIQSNWAEKELAGVDWFGVFLKRHPSLSITTIETTGLGRTSISLAAEELAAEELDQTDSTLNPCQFQSSQVQAQHTLALGLKC